MNLLSGGCSACGLWGLPSSLPQLAGRRKGFAASAPVLRPAVWGGGGMQEPPEFADIATETKRGVGRLGDVEPRWEHIVSPGRAALETTASSKPWVGFSLASQVLCSVGEARSQVPNFRMLISSLKMDSDEVKINEVKTNRMNAQVSHGVRLSLGTCVLAELVPLGNIKGPESYLYIDLFINSLCV